MESSETTPAETPTPAEQAVEAKKQPDGSEATPKQKEGNQRSGRQRGGRKKKGRSTNRPKPIDDSPFGRIQSSYFACARCSFFWSTLRVMLTLPGLEKMVGEQRDGWMMTPWSHTLREHIERCYGVEIFSDTTHYQGTCLECGRNFVVSGGADSAEMTLFEIQAERLAPYPR